MSKSHHIKSNERFSWQWEMLLCCPLLAGSLNRSPFCYKTVHTILEATWFKGYYSIIISNNMSTAVHQLLRVHSHLFSLNSRCSSAPANSFMFQKITFSNFLYEQKSFMALKSLGGNSTSLSHQDCGDVWMSCFSPTLSLLAAPPLTCSQSTPGHTWAVILRLLN